MKKIKKLAVIVLILTFSFCSKSDNLQSDKEYFIVRYEVLGSDNDITTTIVYTDENYEQVEIKVNILPFIKDFRYYTREGRNNIRLYARGASIGIGKIYVDNVNVAKSGNTLKDSAGNRYLTVNYDFN